jgi:hypothetical protein
MSIELIGTENKTGWIVYYICDNSGAGFNRPNYEYLPYEDWDEIKHQIMHNWESWVREAYSFSLKVEMGIVPPTEVLEKEIAKAAEAAERNTKFKHLLIAQKDEFYGGLVRN